MADCDLRHEFYRFMSQFDQAMVLSLLDYMRLNETIESDDPVQIQERLATFDGFLADVPPTFASVYKDTTSADILLIDTLAQTIKSNIRERIPTAIVRIGEGEGRLLANFDTEYPYLAQTCAVSTLKEQFGSENFSRADIGNLQSSIEAGIGNSDVLGLPARGTVRWYFERFSRTKKIGRTDNFLQIYGTVMAIRHCHQLLAGLPQLPQITDALISHLLIPYYPHILGGIRYLGLITCRPNLPSLLKNAFSVARTELFLIPGEAFTADVCPTEPHYPDRFHQLMQDIAVPFPGAVFLVAAGVLAGAYCNRIKQLGGIAIDIGSVVDVWAGIASRPYMGERYVNRWRLAPP
jgi:hypothetical protein